MDNRHIWRCSVAGIAALLVLLITSAAADAACLDDVQKLAESHGVPTEPPTVTPHDKAAPGVTTDQLARSGGVIKPPPSADPSVIEPPKGQDPGMATVPGVKPQPGAPNAATPSAPGAPTAPTDHAGAQRTTLQAALVAARADAERGDEQGCREQLAKAHDILGKEKM
jgi:hypothetical protein